MNHHSEIQEVIDKFYVIMSGSAQEERNWNEFRTLFFSEDSSLTSMKYNSENQCITKRVDVETYITRMTNFLKLDDFYEYGFNYKIEIYGSIASVYT